MTVRILRLLAVLDAVGVSKSTLYQWVRDNAFPPPVKLGSRSVGWRSADVDAWLASRAPANDERAAG
ncbi:helix-turn-helix transcriptional regulator [Burkholderia ubonensis]|uniref:helix-turn-helix transcriptional regulator n=1 Tax=Burkholderia ubonensis TaxID=101571 RepID=UPI0009B39427|nr:AlpA family transcriptional regulator [Burkholderia ubonensis]